METLRVERSSGEIETSPDRTWRGLYQAGGISAALYIVLGIIVPVVILMTMPLPPSSGGVAILQFIASNRLGYMIYWVLFVIWFIAIGWKLYRLGLSSSHESVAKRLEGQATS